MDLCDVIERTEPVRVTGPTDPRILSLAYDSRKATAGSLFFALPGEKLDGAQFALDAIQRGAVAVAGSRARPADIDPRITWIELSPGKERRALALSSANFYGRPADALKLVGVTGTNGKTTTSFLVDSILRAAGFHFGVVRYNGIPHPEG